MAYVDGSGTTHRVEEYLQPGEVSERLGSTRYEGKTKREIEFVFDVERMNPRPGNGLVTVEWSVRSQIA